MKIITTTEAFCQPQVMDLQPGERVVVPDWVAYGVRDRLGASKVRISGAGSYTRHYCGQDLDGKTLIARRGHGLGDQLVFSGILRLLKLRYPQARIIFCVHPGMIGIWGARDKDAPYKQYYQLAGECIPWAEWQAADYHLIGEDLVESNCEPDQPNIWDLHLAWAGIDPATVQDRDKRPVPMLTARAAAMAQAWLDIQPAARAGCHPIILWQLASSSTIRSYPPEQTRRALALLADSAPQAMIIPTGTKADAATYTDLPERANIAPHVGGYFHDIIGLLEHPATALLICPDSCFGHLAAAGPHLPPVLSLWGSFLPQDRVSYYPNHYPLVGGGTCSVCRAHDPDEPPYGCPRFGGYCRAVANIAPEDIVAQALEIITRNPQPATKGS